MTTFTYFLRSCANNLVLPINVIKIQTFNINILYSFWFVFDKNSELVKEILERKMKKGRIMKWFNKKVIKEKIHPSKAEKYIT